MRPSKNLQQPWLEVIHFIRPKMTPQNDSFLNKAGNKFKTAWPHLWTSQKFLPGPQDWFQCPKDLMGCKVDWPDTILRRRICLSRESGYLRSEEPVGKKYFVYSSVSKHFLGMRDLHTFKRINKGFGYIENGIWKGTIQIIREFEYWFPALLQCFIS